jgi:beta-lactam-binding protein with PASTA domain
VKALNKQTVMTRYQIGEPVAKFASALTPIYQARDQALNRDVWIDVYEVVKNAERSRIYDWIRNQVLLNHPQLQSVYDVFEDDSDVYVVGESLRTFCTFKEYLQTTADDDMTVLKRILQVLSLVIEITGALQDSVQVTLDRILLQSESIKLIPRYDSTERNDGRIQAFLLLQTILQFVRNKEPVCKQVEVWLRHAERHAGVIDPVDLKLWLSGLSSFTPSEDVSSTPAPRPISRLQRRDSERASSQRFQNLIRWVRRSPMWARIVCAILALLGLGWIGYNWLNPAVVMPDFRGKSYTEAVRTLEQLGIDPGKIERIDSLGSSQKPGFIFGQEPQPGSHVRLSSSVTLQVSKGLPKLTVPNVVGMTIQQAKTELSKAGFSDKLVQVKSGNPNSTSDVVTTITPSPGSTVDANQTVVLDTHSNSTQSGTILMPNLIGLSMDQAEAILLKIGLHYDYRIEAANAPSHTVFRQSVDPGTPVDTGSHVSFLVAQ